MSQQLDEEITLKQLFHFIYHWRVLFIFAITFGILAGAVNGYLFRPAFESYFRLKMNLEDITVDKTSQLNHHLRSIFDDTDHAKSFAQHLTDQLAKSPEGQGALDYIQTVIGKRLNTRNLSEAQAIKSYLNLLFKVDQQENHRRKKPLPTWLHVEFTDTLDLQIKTLTKATEHAEKIIVSVIAPLMDQMKSYNIQLAKQDDGQEINALQQAKEHLKNTREFYSDLIEQHASSVKSSLGSTAELLAALRAEYPKGYESLKLVLLSPKPEDFTNTAQLIIDVEKDVFKSPKIRDRIEEKYGPIFDRVIVDLSHVHLVEQTLHQSFHSQMNVFLNGYSQSDNSQSNMSQKVLPEMAEMAEVAEMPSDRLRSDIVHMNPGMVRSILRGAVIGGLMGLLFALVASPLWAARQESRKGA